MSRIVCCEVCGNEFIARSSTCKFCDDCRKVNVMKGYKQNCKVCGKPISGKNANHICMNCREAEKEKQAKSPSAVEKEIAKRYHISLARFKSLDKLELVVLENEEYNRTHDQALSYGYYIAMMEGYFKPL